MRIKPLSDHILLETVEEKTDSGIILPESAEKEKPEQAKVVAVGPGKLDENGKRVPMEVKKGDRVLFKKYGPDEIKVGDYLTIIILPDKKVISLSIIEQ